MTMNRKPKREPIQIEIVSRTTWRDRAVSYGAGIIAIASFALSIWQGWIGRQHNRLSVRPVITISETFNGGDPNGLLIANAGSGVAFVEATYIYVDGTLMGEMTPDWWGRAKVAAGITQPMPVNYEWLLHGTVVETGPPEILLVSRHDDKYDPTDLSRGPFEQFGKTRLAFQMAYNSLYGEQWRLKYAQGRNSIDQGKAGTQRYDD